MLHHEIDTENGVLTVTPSGELSAMDFKLLTDAVDEYNARHEPLQSMMILTEHFPGWDSFGAMFQHLKFIRKQRDQVRKIAAVTDSGFLTVMPHIIDHFIKAEVRHFDYADRAQAEAWVRS